MSSEANNEAADAPATDRPATDASTTTEVQSESVASSGDATWSDATSVDAVPAGREGLPSIIIDPSLSEPDGPRPSADVLAEVGATAASAPTAATEQILPTPGAESADAWSAGALSEHDADRFADNLRASWDVGTDSAVESWSAASAPDAHAIASTSHAAAASSHSDSIPPLAISRGLDRRMMIAGGSIVLVIALAIWSWSASEPDVPESWNKDATSGAAPTASTPSQPTPPSTAQTPPSVPTPASAPSEPPTPAPTPVAAVEPIVTPVPVPPVVAPAPVVPTVPKSVHLQISTSPAGADIKLDGDAVPNPFDAWVPRAGTHSITVSAEGFVEREWDVNFDEDRTLALALKRQAVKRAPARRVVRTPTPRAPTPRATTPSRSRPRGAGFVTDNPY